MPALLVLCLLAQAAPAAAQTPSPGSPVPLQDLHLDQAGAMVTYGASTSTDPSVCSGSPARGHSYSGSASLTSGSAGALLVLSFSSQIPFTSSASIPFSVMQMGTGQLQLQWNLSTSTTISQSWAMTGIGARFTGTATVVTASSGCRVVADETLTLAGAGLTLVTPSSSPNPIASSTPTVTPGAPPWFLRSCNVEDVQNRIFVIQSDVSLNQALNQDRVFVRLQQMLQGGIVTGTLTFDGGGSGTSSVANRPGGAPVRLLDSGGGPSAYSCTDPCVVAFDGGTGSGSSVAYHPEGDPRHCLPREPGAT